MLLRARDSLGLQVGRPDLDWLSAQTPKTTQIADQALIHFAENDEWPAVLPSVVRYQLWIRVVFGLDWMLMNADAGMPVPVSLAGGDLPKAFLETVVDDWHSEGAAWLILRFASSQSESTGG